MSLEASKQIVKLSGREIEIPACGEESQVIDGGLKGCTSKGVTYLMRDVNGSNFGFNRNGVNILLNVVHTASTTIQGEPRTIECIGNAVFAEENGRLVFKSFSHISVSSIFRTFLKYTSEKIDDTTTVRTKQKVSTKDGNLTFEQLYEALESGRMQFVAYDHSEKCLKFSYDAEAMQQRTQTSTGMRLGTVDTAFYVMGEDVETERKLDRDDTLENITKAFKAWING